jgi:hypothetical protein
MALAFFIMLLPGFTTSIDLTAIRDRFAGIIVGIVAMWIFFDHLWHTSSRRQLVEKLAAILRVESRAAEAVSPALAPAEARRRAHKFRGELINELDSGRLFLDETKIELTLSLEPRTVRGEDLEVAARDVSFAAFALLALNEKKLRLLDEGRLAGLEPVLRPADEALARNLTALAGEFARFEQELWPAGETEQEEAALPPVDLMPVRLGDPQRAGAELRTVYDALDMCVRRIVGLRRVAQRLV